MMIVEIFCLIHMKDNHRAKFFEVKLEMHIQILGRGRHGNAQKNVFFAIFDASKHFRLYVY